MQVLTIALAARINEIQDPQRSLRELPGQYQLFCRRRQENIEILLLLRTDQPSQILCTILEKEGLSAKVLFSRFEPLPSKQELQVLFLDDLTVIVRGFSNRGFVAASEIESNVDFDTFDHIDDFDAFDIYDDLNADQDFRATSISEMLQNSLSKKPLELLFGMGYLPLKDK